MKKQKISAPPGADKESEVLSASAEHQSLTLILFWNVCSLRFTALLLLEQPTVVYVYTELLSNRISSIICR